jgi:hypothetical protein
MYSYEVVVCHNPSRIWNLHRSFRSAAIGTVGLTIFLTDLRFQALKSQIRKVCSDTLDSRQARSNCSSGCT